MQYTKKVTVFTPTYNRAHTIYKLYESLTRQSINDFEWIVIDDGSTDNTEILFDDIVKKTNDFPIKYIKKENEGKHIAINKGVEIAQGELFFIIDSDDYISDNAIERLIYWRNTLVDIKTFAGVAGNRCNENGIIGDSFKEDYIDATTLERVKFNIIGDKAEAFFTDVLKKYPFPKFNNENFLAEGVIWMKIAYDGLKIRWFNENIYICHYLNDGLTNAGDKSFYNNPIGYLYFVKKDLEYNNYSFYMRMASYYNYYRIMSRKKSYIECANDLEISKIILIIAIILKKAKHLIKGKKNDETR